MQPPLSGGSCHAACLQRAASLRHARMLRYNRPMPKAIGQAERLDAERKHAPQPSAHVVEQRYRLQPADLPPGGLQAEVMRVTKQGVEAVIPVMHLRTVSRPLLLDDANVRRMTALAGSPLHEDWIGIPVALRVENEAAGPAIRLFSPDAARAENARASGAPAWRGQLRAALVLLLVLAVAFGAVFAVENWKMVLNQLGIPF